MTKRTIAAGAAAALLLLVLVAAYLALERGARPAAGGRPAAERPPAAETAVHRSLLYGRVTTIGGASYEGRLRFGGDEEAFWGDFFNGVKDDNRWISRVPPGRLPTERGGFEILGIPFGGGERPVELRRPFMARFGDLARIEARGTEVRVTLKSGTATDLDRLEASDFDDGVRVWDAARGTVDLDSNCIRSIELLPSPRPAPPPDRLHGTVRTRAGNEFTGFLQWNRQASLGADTLEGRAGGSGVTFRFDRIRAIARDSARASRVTLTDGRELVLSGTSAVGAGNRGVYVDDVRYGRVLVSWDAFERVEFSPPGTPAGGGPGYGDFPPGRPLSGSVTTREGRRIAGRIVFDLDESETTETLDAPAAGVDYTIPFARIASIVPHGGGEGATGPATLALRSGERLHLDPAGDLGDANAGLLVFPAGPDHAEYVPWSEVRRIEFDPPPAAAELVQGGGGRGEE